MCISDIPLKLSILLRVIVWIKCMRWNTAMECWQFLFFLTVYRECILCCTPCFWYQRCNNKLMIYARISSSKVVRMWLRQKQEFKDWKDRGTTASQRRLAVWCHWLLQVAYWARKLFMLSEEACPSSEVRKVKMCKWKYRHPTCYNVMWPRTYIIFVFSNHWFLKIVIVKQQK